MINYNENGNENENRSHGYDINRRRSRHGHRYTKNKKCVSLISNILAAFSSQFMKNLSNIEV